MKFSFKAYKGDQGSVTDASSEPANKQQKRKEQVRRAQRTHRERKEAYTASIEVEVVQLRANEARIMEETRSLYAEINLLRSLLTARGIPIPTTHGYQPSLAEEDPKIRALTEAANPNFSFHVQQTKRKDRPKQITVQRKSARSIQSPHDQILTNPASLADASVTTGSTPDYHAITTPISEMMLSGAQPSPPSATYLGELDPTVVGMDFVLTLESPCLGHIDVARSDGNPSATGHALTVSACLLHHAPTLPGRRLESAVPWEMPGVGIERLLELSREVPLSDGEVTPVQAWDYIRKQAQYSSLEIARLETLKEKLVGFVRCYGFGGVIEQGVFENLVFDAFIVGRVF